MGALDPDLVDHTNRPPFQKPYATKSILPHEPPPAYHATSRLPMPDHNNAAAADDDDDAAQNACPYSSPPADPTAAADHEDDHEDADESCREDDADDADGDDSSSSSSTTNNIVYISAAQMAAHVSADADAPSARPATKRWRDYPYIRVRMVMREEEREQPAASPPPEPSRTVLVLSRAYRTHMPNAHEPHFTLADLLELIPWRRMEGGPPPERLRVDVWHYDSLQLLDCDADVNGVLETGGPLPGFVVRLVCRERARREGAEEGPEGWDEDDWRGREGWRSLVGRVRVTEEEVGSGRRRGDGDEEMEEEDGQGEKSERKDSKGEELEREGSAGEEPGEEDSEEQGERVDEMMEL